MATVDLRPNANNANYVEAEGWNLKPYTFVETLNFSQVPTAGPWNTGVRSNVQAVPTGEVMMNQPGGVARTPGASDVYQVLKVPANSKVQIALQLVTAQGSTCTCAVATDEGSAQTFIAAFDLNGTPGSFKPLDAGSYASYKDFTIGTADCNITITADGSHAISAAVAKICVIVTPLTPVQPALVSP